MELDGVPAESANMKPSTVFSTTKRKSLKKVILFLLILIIYSAGLIGATYLVTNTVNEKNLKAVLSSFHNSNSPLFLNLTGTFNGKIVEIKGDKAWVNTNKGGKIILSIKEPVQISEFSGSKVNLIGTTIDKIKLNQDATITVAGYGPGYIITSVTYQNGPIPSLNPELIASPSAKPATPSARIKK